jgi:hypothetical protein
MQRSRDVKQLKTSINEFHAVDVWEEGKQNACPGYGTRLESRPSKEMSPLSSGPLLPSVNAARQDVRGAVRYLTERERMSHRRYYEKSKYHLLRFWSPILQC